MKRIILTSFFTGLLIILTALSSPYYNALVKNSEKSVQKTTVKPVKVVKSISKNAQNIKYYTKVDNKYFYFLENNSWKRTFIKGVNINSNIPGYSPVNNTATKEDYLRWLDYIEKMNANSIRVHTLLKPEFYQALYEYNLKTKKPIMLFQSVGIGENDMLKYKNANNQNIMNKFETDIKNQIDVLHGKAVFKTQNGTTDKYTYDVSKYVAGLILGNDWNSDFIMNTDNLEKGSVSYDGKYLNTSNATPFETFLCKMGDYALDYETTEYNTQRPLSFINWITTDSNVSSKNDLQISINTDHIKAKDSFKAGLFASFNVCNLYADKLSYTKSIKAKDNNSYSNLFKTYLGNLIKQTHIPALVVEFGIPTTRGTDNAYLKTLFNQGYIDENSQSQMDASMIKDIYDEGYTGGLVKNWHDDWSKRSWNTTDYDTPVIPNWSDPQTSEQGYGIIAFDPGKDKSICYVDANINDWQNTKPLIDTDNIKLYMKNDEKYIYLMLNTKGIDFDKDKMIIPIGTIDKVGSNSIKDFNLNFSNKADFAIMLNGKNDSHLLVNSYYDMFYYKYGYKSNLIQRQQEYEKPNNIFNPINLCLNEKTKLLSYYETGRLIYGDANPSDKNYNSAADFYYNGNILELRIPYALLNFMDPSTGTVVDDLYKIGIKSYKISGISVGAALINNNRKYMENIDMKLYKFNTWNAPLYHERLKLAYYSIQKAFLSVGN